MTHSVYATLYNYVMKCGFYDISCFTLTEYYALPQPCYTCSALVYLLYLAILVWLCNIGLILPYLLGIAIFG